LLQVANRLHREIFKYIEKSGLGDWTYVESLIELEKVIEKVTPRYDAEPNEFGLLLPQLGELGQTKIWTFQKKSII